MNGEGEGLRGLVRQVWGLLTVNKRALLVTAGNAFGRNFSHLTFSPKITAAKIFLFIFFVFFSTFMYCWWAFGGGTGALAGNYGPESIFQRAAARWICLISLLYDESMLLLLLLFCSMSWMFHEIRITRLWKLRWKLYALQRLLYTLSLKNNYKLNVYLKYIKYLKL